MWHYVNHRLYNSVSPVFQLNHYHTNADEALGPKNRQQASDFQFVLFTHDGGAKRPRVKDQ